MRHVLDHIRAHGRDSETLNVIYIVDDQNKLIDDLRIREILLAPLHAHVSDLMDNKFVSLCVTDDKKKAVEVFRKYDRTALPVVDTQGRLAGIVTLDDVIDVAEEEATREIQKIRRPGSPRRSLHEHALARDGPQAGDLARHPVRRRDADGDGHGLLREPDRTRRRAGPVRPPDHLERRQLRARRRPRSSSGPWPWARSGSNDWWRVMRREILAGLLLGTILGCDRLRPDRRLARRFNMLRARTGSWSA